MRNFPHHACRCAPSAQFSVASIGRARERDEFRRAPRSGTGNHPVFKKTWRTTPSDDVSCLRSPLQGCIDCSLGARTGRPKGRCGRASSCIASHSTLKNPRGTTLFDRARSTLTSTSWMPCASAAGDGAAGFRWPMRRGYGSSRTPSTFNGARPPGPTIRTSGNMESPYRCHPRTRCVAGRGDADIPELPHRDDHHPLVCGRSAHEKTPWPIAVSRDPSKGYVVPRERFELSLPIKETRPST